MAEQLAFNQGLGNGCTVDRHKRASRPVAVLMDGSRHQFLTGAVFAADQHSTIGRAGRFDQLLQLLHDRRLADELELPLDFGAEVAILLLEPVLIQGMFHPEGHIFEGQRLFDIVVRTQFDRLDRRLDRTVPGHHHDLSAGHQFAQSLEGLQPVHLGHPDIQHHQFRRTDRAMFQGLHPAFGHTHVISFVLENTAQGIQDGDFVINNENRSRHASPTYDPPTPTRPSVPLHRQFEGK